MDTVQQAQLPFDGSETASRTTARVGRTDGREQRAATNHTAPAPPHQADADRANGTYNRGAQRPMLLTVRDLESELQLGRTRTYQLLRTGEIPSVRVGERALRVTREDLNRWIESKRKHQNES